MTDFRTRIAVLDYGMGNLHSVSKALEHVAPKAEVIITSDKSEVDDADRVVFPGVGAIRDCMAEIRRLGFDKLVAKAVTEKPVLGICVGMQALLQHSEENGGVDCLDILPGNVRFFGRGIHDAQGEKLKVPHMGWNRVHQTIDHPMWQGIKQDSRFYFVHSYYVEAAGADGRHQEMVAGSCDYSVRFAAALTRDNLFAVQFHPEKSHTAGLQLLSNFVTWQGNG
jgi:glutamine amidotransferase